MTERNAFTTIGFGKYALTDESGVATFTQLNVMDVNGDVGCFRFRFAIGEPGMSQTTTSSTEILCFKNNYIVQLLPGYSTHVAPYQDFYSPVQIKVRSYVTL